MDCFEVSRARDLSHLRNIVLWDTEFKRPLTGVKIWTPNFLFTGELWDEDEKLERIVRNWLKEVRKSI